MVRCVKCGTLQNLKTNKSHINKKRALVYNANTMAAGVMIHSGLSVTEMEKYKSSSEVPSVSGRTMKKREIEIGVTKKTLLKSLI